MASDTGAVWAIDIGSSSLKALHLALTDRGVEVIGFDSIAHSKVLMAGAVSEVERDELIALSLRRFLERNDIDKDEIIISVPSQNSFARFVTLPPVETKRIPEIVQFEAAQQIPFDIGEVQWDWQLMTGEESAEKKVGIFAIKNEAVDMVLDFFSRENITVSYVQITPMALYNYILYDRPDLLKKETRATVVLNIGAENTDLIVCTKSTVWQRCIPMGGNSFTQAISDAFKLNLEKSEKLKRTAPMSKYARQILQAMKPVFTDLASEIQRSLGFYNSSHPNTRLSKIVAFGGGTKMRGLLKYLQQTLQIPIERPDSFKRLLLGSGVSAAKFHESVSDFGVVYGLGLQVLGLGRIESNLLPENIARSMAWVAKSRYFIAASCLLLFVSLLSLGRVNLDKINYSKKKDVRQKISNVINSSQQAISKEKEQQARASNSASIIAKAYAPFKYRDIIALLYETVTSSLPNEKNHPEQSHLYRAFKEGQVADVLQFKRDERKQLFVTSMSMRFVEDAGSADFESEDLPKRAVRRKTPKKVSLPSEYVEMASESAAYIQPERGGRPGYSPSVQVPGANAAVESKKDEKVVEEGAGFVLQIAGYSPYKKIGELLDPVGVDDEPSKWGFVTRLMHLDDVADGNSLFKLYRKTEVKHFKLETGDVSLESGDSKMPEGIGMEDTRLGKSVKSLKGVEEKTEERILIDPMTKEIISTVAELDENGEEKRNRFGKVIYKENDHWFRLSCKLVWREAPKKK